MSACKLMKGISIYLCYLNKSNDDCFYRVSLIMEHYNHKKKHNPSVTLSSWQNDANWVPFYSLITKGRINGIIDNKPDFFIFGDFCDNYHDTKK